MNEFSSRREWEKGKGAGIEEIMPPRHVELEIVIWHSVPGIWHWQGHLHRPGCRQKKTEKNRKNAGLSLQSTLPLTVLGPPGTLSAVT